MIRKLMSAVAIAAVSGTLLLGGCASTPAPTSTDKPAAAATQASESVKSLFVALPEDGRIYYFTDTKLYFDYLNTEEVALRQTRIGAGPSGQTVVFALSDADVKAKTASLAERLYDGKIAADDKGFYGEVFKDGRFYVFDRYPDMKAFIEHGEVGLAITDIGAGPKGETLVWVLNNETAKKGRPTARIERFKTLRGMK
ncbi:MAG: hypothetical protein ACUVWX_13035 [Kiritimatiellia bacterium]